MRDSILRREYAEQLKLSYLQSGFKQGFEAGYAKAKADFERPQGKWNMDKRGRAFLFVRECLNCHEGSAVGNYCMWCGADMREGEEE